MHKQRMLGHIANLVDTAPMDCKTCEEACCTGSCLNTELYYIITALCLVIVALSGSSLILYRMYKREQKLRLTMWKVKEKDIFVDNNQFQCSVAGGDCALYGFRHNAGKQRPKHHHTHTGVYKDRTVAMKRLRSRRMSLERPSIVDMDQICMLEHEHVCKFYGAHYEGTYVTLLTEYCTRGSLQDLLSDHREWDDIFKNSLIFDIIKGMIYLHRSPVQSHGNLKPSNCLIDSRFMVKLTDFGCIGQRLKGSRKSKEEAPDPFYKKLWTAPELLRSIIPPNEGSQKGDVYSFAIIAQEILYQRGPFYRREDEYSPEEIVQRVSAPKSEAEWFRPCLDDDDDVVINSIWRKTLRRCWSERPKDRPAFNEIYDTAAILQKDSNLVDNLLQRLQQYSDRLEEQVEEKTEQYKREKERSDSLLYQMLPRPVAERLKLNTDVKSEYFESVTVYFSDIVGFSEICHNSKPLEVVNMLNDLYTMFDQTIEEFDVYKVETIGDAYMVASGLPDRNGNLHAREIARMALKLLDKVTNHFEIQNMPVTKLRLRVGIHTGSVVAGVVGLKMPRYCLFGDTVNTAARMEQNGKEFQLHVSSTTKEILDQFGTFQLTKRKDSVVLKGIGERDTWWLTGETPRVDENGATAAVTLPLRDSGVDSPTKLRMTSTGSSLNSSAACTPEGAIDAVFTFENEKPQQQQAMRQSQSVCGMAQVPTIARSNLYTAPPRYRASVNANQHKQRRNGMTVRPTLVLPGLPFVPGSPSPGYRPFEPECEPESKEACGPPDAARRVRKLGAQQTHGAEQVTAERLSLGRDSGIYLAFDNGACSPEEDALNATDKV